MKVDYIRALCVSVCVCGWCIIHNSECLTKIISKCLTKIRKNFKTS